MIGSKLPLKKVQMINQSMKMAPAKKKIKLLMMFQELLAHCPIDIFMITFCEKSFASDPMSKAILL